MESKPMTMDMDMLKPQQIICKITKPVQLTQSSDRCPFHRCDGTGVILVEYPPYGYAKEYAYPHTVAHKCECKGKANTEYRRSRALLPPEYINVKPFDFDWQIYKTNIDPIKNIINDFVVNFEEFEKKSFGLFIKSKVKGSGKTMLSCIIANQLIDRYSLSVKFITVIDFLELVKKSYKNDEYQEEIDALFKARLLILDDIGIEKQTDHTDMKLYQLINDRCNKHLTTIFTSNLSINEIKLDERIIDRINKMSIAINIPEVPVRRLKSDDEKRKFLNRIRTN